MMTPKFKMIAAVVAVLALITAGTFAMQQVISETNEFFGSYKPGDPILHDDFDPNTDLKDVYVENVGTNDLYVRIKLNEFMDLTTDKRPSSITDWKTHKYVTSAADCANANAAGRLFHDYFKWTMGGQKYYMPATTGPKVQDKTIYTGSEPGVKQTPNAQIITSAAFLAMTEAEQEAFIGWIFAEDGYAYWSQPLKKGEATGLLLNGVESVKNMLKDKDYYYAIDVILEVVDLADIPMWTEGAPSVDDPAITHPPTSEDGKEVIEIIVGKEKPQVNEGIKINGGNKTLSINEEYTPGFTTTPANFADGKTVNWESSNNSIATVDANGKITGKSEGTVTITVTVGDKKDTITITVKADAPPGPGPVCDCCGEDEDTCSADENCDCGCPDCPGTDKGNGVLEVKPPSDPNMGYTSLSNEYCQFISEDAMANIIFIRTGALRLENILVSSDYTGLKVTPQDSKYNGEFEIGKTKEGKDSILYSTIPEKATAKQQYLDNKKTTFPITTTLLLEQNGKSAIIKVTMEYDVNIVWSD